MVKRVAVCVFLVVLCGLCIGEVPTFSLTDLGVQGFRSHCNGINDSGQVVGDVLIQPSTDTQEAILSSFVWSRKEGAQDISELAGLQVASAIDINNEGTIVGAYWRDGEYRPYLWNPTEGFSELDLMGYEYGAGIAINDSGQIAGRLSKSPSIGAFWDPVEGVMVMDSLQDDLTLVYGMNNLGQVVGGSSYNGKFHAFVWQQDEGMLDLGLLGGEVSIAYGINDHGQVVGQSTVDDSERHGFMWERSQGMWSIGVLPDKGAIRATDINNSGWIAGSYGSGDNIRGLVWIPEHGMFELADLVDESAEGWTILHTDAINEHGQIAATALNPLGKMCSILLTPVPDVIEADLRVYPRMLNPKSHRRMIVAKLSLPEDVAVDQIDLSEPLVLDPGGIESVTLRTFPKRDEDARFDIYAFFNAKELFDSIEGGESLEIVVSGTLLDGTVFEGTDSVKVLKHAPEKAHPRERASRRR